MFLWIINSLHPRQIFPWEQREESHFIKVIPNVSLSAHNLHHKKILDSLALFICELTSELDCWKTWSSHKAFASLPCLGPWKDTKQAENKQASSHQNDYDHLIVHASHSSSYVVSSLPPMIACSFLIWSMNTTGVPNVEKGTLQPVTHWNADNDQETLPWCSKIYNAEKTKSWRVVSANP